MVGQMLGSTCCHTMPTRPVPDVRAAVMYCWARTRLETTRVSRATIAETDNPMATVTVSSEDPVTATTSIASRSSGKAIRMSMPADKVSSSQPAANAAPRPIGMPIAAPTATAPSPTIRAMRAPTMICVDRSWPSRSVPSQWLSDGPSRRLPVVSLGSYGSHSNDTSAMSRIVPTRTSPTMSATERRFLARPPSGGTPSWSAAASGWLGMLTVMPMRVAAAGQRRAARRLR